MTPQMQRVRGGWHAHGDDFAVFGQTEDEARLRFQEAQRRHAEILNRQQPQRVSPSELPRPSSQSRADARD